MPFENISADEHVAFISSLKSGQYNLLLGAGASLDSSNERGRLPSGGAFKNDLARLKEANQTQALQRIFALLNEAEIEEHVRKRFSDCTPGPTYQLLSTFIWKRAFTFNIQPGFRFFFDPESSFMIRSPPNAVQDPTSPTSDR
jgi:hypothetical protein